MRFTLSFHWDRLFTSSKWPLSCHQSSLLLEAAPPWHPQKNIMLSENCWQKDWCSRTNLLRGEVDYFAWPHYQRLKCLSLEIINLENLHLWFKIKDKDFPKMKMALLLSTWCPTQCYFFFRWAQAVSLTAFSVFFVDPFPKCVRKENYER